MVIGIAMLLDREEFGGTTAIVGIGRWAGRPLP
jgi:hypothetical protein